MRPMRFPAVVAVAALASCSHMRGFRQTAPRPADFDAVAAAAVLVDHPLRVQRESRSGNPEVLLRDGDAHAWFAFDAHTLEVSSAWISETPTGADLDRSLQLQNEIVARLGARWPAVPAVGAWRVECVA